MTLEIKDSEEVGNLLTSDKKLVGADFWAPWSPYCMRLKPVFEAFAEEYPDIKFVKVNVNEEFELASRYEIQGIIPVAKFFCADKETGEMVGYDVPQQILKNEIERISRSIPSCLENSSSLLKSNNNIVYFVSW